MLFTLDDSRLVRIFNANGVKMSLKKAFELARIIEGIHLERLNEVENNSFDAGKKHGLLELDRKAEDSYARGYGKGLADAKSDLDEGVVRAIVAATTYANLRFDSINLGRKLGCIKHLRREFPLLGLRQAKEIVDQCLGEGTGVSVL
jgi:hypothetical protein